MNENESRNSEYVVTKSNNNETGRIKISKKDKNANKEEHGEKNSSAKSLMVIPNVPKQVQFLYNTLQMWANMCT